MSGWKKAAAVLAFAIVAGCASSNLPPRHPEERLHPDEPLVCRKINEPNPNPTQPHIVQVPMGKDLANHYPAAAAKRAMSGEVVLDCRYREDGSLACTVADETPPGWGFGLAALAVAPCFRGEAGPEQRTSLSESVVEIPIAFHR